MKDRRAIILMHCPDAKGIVASITEFLFNNRGNIINLDQHTDSEQKIFFMRIEWELSEFLIPDQKIDDYFETMIASKFNIKFTLYFSDETPRMAIFVTKMPHCLLEILASSSSKEWNVEIPLIISNHETLKPIALQNNIDFYHLPVTPENKSEQEDKQIELLKQYNIDFIVLARYMQIISDKMINLFTNKIINIHHSFLPAFPGAKPYHSAHERGVKLIGATSHYVTQELDAGPIITQNVAHITHKDSVKDLIRKGKDLEKTVLTKAIWSHIKRKILSYNNRTIIFD